MSVSVHLQTLIQRLVAAKPDADELIALLNGGASGPTALALAQTILNNGALPPNVFRVDINATPADAVNRVYPTADLACAAAEAASGLFNHVIWLTEGQTHAAWTGAAVTGDRSITFACIADRAATIPITLAAPLPPCAGGPGAQSIRFARVIADYTANTDFGDWEHVAQNAREQKTGAPITVLADTHNFEDSDVANVLYTSTNAVLSGSHKRSHFAYVPFGASAAFTQTGAQAIVSDDCSYDVLLGVVAKFTLFDSFGMGAAPNVTALGTRITLRGGLGTLEVVNGAYATAVLEGDVYREATTVTNYGIAATTSQITWHGTDPDDGNLPTGAWHNVAGFVKQV